MIGWLKIRRCVHVWLLEAMQPNKSGAAHLWMWKIPSFPSCLGLSSELQPPAPYLSLMCNRHLKLSVSNCDFLSSSSNLSLSLHQWLVLWPLFLLPTHSVTEEILLISPSKWIHCLNPSHHPSYLHPFKPTLPLPGLLNHPSGFTISAISSHFPPT